MRSPFMAITIGVGLGLLCSIAGQKFLNRMALAECRANPQKDLVTLSSFIGDARYCLSPHATGRFTSY